jgi:hypothetical protein
MEADGKVSYTFHFTNLHNAPIVIEKVLSTCGCTVSTYSKRPIKPDETGFVTITFNPKGLSNIVSKNITIVCNSGQSINNLTIKGTIELDHKLDDEFPYKLAPDVYADKLTLAFGQIQQNSTPKELVVKICNRSSRNVELFYALANNSKCLTIFMPKTIVAKTIAQIRIVAKAPQTFYGSFMDKIIISVNSKKCQPLQTFGTIIDDLRNVSLINGPKFKSSQNYYNLGKIKVNKRQYIHMQITNEGKQPLIIRKIEYKRNIESDFVKTRTLGSGESTNITFTIIPQAIQPLEGSAKFITNDPQNYIHVVTFNATVIQ